MGNPRPPPNVLLGKNPKDVPMSLQRILKATHQGERFWIGPKDAVKLNEKELEAYSLAHKIMAHICIQAPTKHTSGHPGGPLSSFTFTYFLNKRRKPGTDQPLRMSAGHLSLLAYGMQWLFGREGDDARLQSPEKIIETFRTPAGLPGHAEAGIGDIPFGAGPLGKGVSNALGAAFGLLYLKKPGTVDVLMADGDSQEGQIMEAFRLAPKLKLGNLVVHGDWNDIQLSDMPSKTVVADFARLAEAAGWKVIEVQNGNDPGQVVAALDLAETLRNKEVPIFLCYYTTMGHGVKLMEEGANTGSANFHGSPLKDEQAENALKELPSLPELVKSYETFRKEYVKRPKYEPPEALPFSLDSLKGNYTRTVTKEKGSARTDFGAVHLKALMKADPRIVVLHADLAGSGGFEKVAKEFPGRVTNVGVAEANMYMMAAGMRQVGLLPVTYTFAAFGTNEARANARLIDINCGHTRCAVLHDCTHAGLSVGEDGETHQERHYLNIPFDHTQVWMPADSNQAAAMAEAGLGHVAKGQESVFVFFPRSGSQPLETSEGKLFYDNTYVFEGKIDRIRGEGNLRDQATILATGIAVHDAVHAADELSKDHHMSVRVLNVSSIRPLDASSIIQAALETLHLIVVEDHSSEGGLATQVADVIADFQLPCSLRRLGVNRYFPSGTDKDLKILAGLDTDSIVDAVQDEISSEVCGGEDVLVTVVHTLEQLSRRSRFGKTVEVFLEKIRNEKGYLEELRNAWKKRAIPPGNFPSNETLRERW